MSAAFPGISEQAWETAASRLLGVGVFADEERQLPSYPVIQSHLPQFCQGLQSKGYTGGPLQTAEVDQPQEGIDYLIFDSNRFSDLRAAMAAWYQDYTGRWRTRVAERVNDWVRRLDELKSMIGGWLPPDMSISHRPLTRTNEELMQKFNVPSTEMPTFDVIRNNDRVMRVQPKGLWIIGANGRVDLVTKSASYILVDESDPLSGHPTGAIIPLPTNRNLHRWIKVTF